MNGTRALIRLMVALAATFLLAGCCGYGHSFRPHPLEIAADAQGCPTSVQKAEGYLCVNNAREEGLCAHPGDWVKWSRAESGGFQIEFTGYTRDAGYPKVTSPEGGSGEDVSETGRPSLAAARVRGNPMEEDCDLTAEGESLKCRIAEDAAAGTYKYSVIVENCEVLDPRIIIR